MIIIDKVISPNKKVIKTTEVYITYDVIREFIYDNPMHLFLSLWERNEFYNTYYILKDEIDFTRGDFG